MKTLINCSLILMISLLLSGCFVLESGDKTFDSEHEEIETGLPHEEYIPLIKAVENTQSDLLEQFWFRAFVANDIEKRRITHMTHNGIIDREEERYYAVNSFATRSYDYFRDPDNVFLRRSSNWFEGREPVVPFGIFDGFEEWGPYLEDAEVVGTDEVLGIPVFVHEITLSGSELMDLNPETLQMLTGQRGTRLEPILNNTSVTVQFRVGDDTQASDDLDILPVIYQYNTWIDMPIPGAGYMEQEIQYFLFRVNDPGIDMVNADEIAPFVIETDQIREEMEEQYEEEQERLEELEAEQEKENDD